MHLKYDHGACLGTLIAHLFSETDVHPDFQLFKLLVDYAVFVEINIIPLRRREEAVPLSGKRAVILTRGAPS